MNLIYDYILEFIDAFFPNSLDSSLAKLNEILAYILTIGLIYYILSFFIKLVFGRKQKK